MRGCNLWVRIKGGYPSSCKLKTVSGEGIGEWRADGNQTVIYGEAIDREKGETNPTAYKIENRVKPIELAFDEINWPEEVVLPWKNETVSSDGVKNIEELQRLYGEPYYTHKNGISLNESFWAGLFDSENIVLWEPSERAFYSYRADTGIYEEESADAIKRRISDRLLKASRQMNCFELEKQRSDSRLNSIVAHLRGIAGAARRVRAARAQNPSGKWRVFFRERWGTPAVLAGFVSRNRSPIVFDENARCDRFLNELVYPAVHKDDVLLLQKYAGHVLAG